MPQNLVQAVRQAGVVGAGGAGFPTYKKIDTRAELVIANGAECEPLLYKDQTLMEQGAAEMMTGLELIMSHTKAPRGIVAVKRKNRTAIEALSAHLPDDVSIFEMDDVYPAGDEYEVVYHATGRRIPPGGYPVDIGVVVQNVETLYNVCRAADGYPVTHSLMTIHGHVQQPVTAWFPIGMSYRDVLDAAGGPTIEDFALVNGGPMMGNVVTDVATPVTKISSGFVVLPAASRLATKKAQLERAFKRFGKSACDQCSLCTEMCPRYLLGYPIQPHLVMRSLLTTGALSDTLTHWAQACCECNICTLWACPEELDPRNVCVVTKRDLREHDRWLSAEQLQKLSREVHPLKEYRSVPTARLTRRLGLSQFTADAPYQTHTFTPRSVAIPVRQHLGVPAVPTVTRGDRVATGDVIAREVGDQLSVPVHASIGGTVRSVSDVVVIDEILQADDKG
jgi:Na+-translocating ferredoxin:NAD+ oxidoreductase RnfC subunit